MAYLACFLMVPRTDPKTPCYKENGNIFISNRVEVYDIPQPLNYLRTGALRKNLKTGVDLDTNLINLTAKPRSAMQQVPFFFTRMFLLFRSLWAIAGLP